MLRGLLNKIVGDANAKELSRLQPFVDEINALEAECQQLSDPQLQGQIATFRQEIQDSVAEQRAHVAQLQQELAAEATADRRLDVRVRLQSAKQQLRDAEEAILEQYKEWLSKSQAVILVEYTGVTMKDLDGIRAWRHRLILCNSDNIKIIDVKFL